MRTSAVGNKPLKARSGGFTLLELLVVVALMALATAGVGLALRDSADSALERDAERLAALLETGRAQARANGMAVVWRAQAPREGDQSAPSFVFEGLPAPGLPQNWLSENTRAAPGAALLLGPEPLIAPQAVALSNLQGPGKVLWVVTDGLRPFKVQSSPTGQRP